mmetsp:Transcript_47962/g.95424  ORF Transcript_47962/g.95424 Transcript_47962/m.95424 type:complete len:180 (+) Transcript_47962:83-622(+)
MPWNPEGSGGHSPARATKQARPLSGDQNPVEGEGLPVWLHIYDLGCVSKFVVNSWAGTQGIFHVGIEVLDKEWCYMSRHGLRCHRAMEHPHHLYKESIALGETMLSAEQVKQKLGDFQQTWPGSAYHFLQRNCIHFAEEFHKALQLTEPFPEWVHCIPKEVMNLSPKALPSVTPTFYFF